MATPGLPSGVPLAGTYPSMPASQGQPIADGGTVRYPSLRRTCLCRKDGKAQIPTARTPAQRRLPFFPNRFFPLGAGVRTSLRFSFFGLAGVFAAFLPVSGIPSSTIENCSLRSCARMRSRITCTRSPARKLRPHALADNLVRILAPRVAVVAQRVDRHQPLDKQVRQLDKQPILGRIQHQRGKLLAHPVLHEADLLPLHQLALGLGRAALGQAGLLRNLRQLRLRNRRLAGEC